MSAPTGRPPKFTIKQLARILEEWDAGPYSSRTLPNSWIAERLGVTEGAVRAKRARAQALITT